MRNLKICLSLYLVSRVIFKQYTIKYWQKESFALIKFATKFEKTPGYLKRVLIKYLLVHIHRQE